MVNFEQVWRDYDLPIGSEHCWEIGSLRLQARFEDSEVWLANSELTTTENENPSLASQKEPPEWGRWALAAPPSAITIEPEFPDKSLVVKPDNSFKLLPGVEARIFVRVPIWVKVSIPPGGKSKLLAEYPSVVLSLTWFGTTMEGELCYWLASSIRRSISPDLFAPNLALCPVIIKNRSSEELVVDKLCLRVKWLSLYQLDSQLWSDETTISYQGTGEVSHVDVSERPPVEAKGAKLIVKPREVNKKGLAIRTFFNL
jgi:hypothetical protein